MVPRATGSPRAGLTLQKTPFCPSKGSSRNCRVSGLRSFGIYRAAVGRCSNVSALGCRACQMIPRIHILRDFRVFAWDFLPYPWVHKISRGWLGLSGSTKSRPYGISNHTITEKTNPQSACGHSPQCPAIPAGTPGGSGLSSLLVNENLSYTAPFTRSPCGGGGGFRFRYLFRNQHPPDYRERESPLCIRGHDPRTIHRVFVEDRAARRSGIMAADPGCPKLEALAEIASGPAFQGAVAVVSALVFPNSTSPRPVSESVPWWTYWKPTMPSPGTKPMIWWSGDVL